MGGHDATKPCGLRAVAVSEKELRERAEELAALLKRLAKLGKAIGPPWGADRKNTALAALTVMRPSLE